MLFATMSLLFVKLSAIYTLYARKWHLVKDLATAASNL
jgi:hypothetical protein